MLSRLVEVSVILVRRGMPGIRFIALLDDREVLKFTRSLLDYMFFFIAVRSVRTSVLLVGFVSIAGRRNAE